MVIVKPTFLVIFILPLTNDPIDIYSQHDSKAGTDMSAEVTEIIDNVHQMTTTKRCLIGIGIFIFVVIVIVGIIFIMKM